MRSIENRRLARLRSAPTCENRLISPCGAEVPRKGEICIRRSDAGAVFHPPEPCGLRRVSLWFPGAPPDAPKASVWR